MSLNNNGFLPDYSLPMRNRRVLLKTRPNGIPEATNFRIDEETIASPGEGQFLVRNIYLSVDPAQRGWVNEDKNYSAPVPLGSVMRALAVGEVLESRHPSYPVGSFAYGWFGWQDYCVAGPEQVMSSIRDLTAPLSAYAGILGMNGLTAWLAFAIIGRPRAGDRVLVSTAAGSVGSVVGQLARAGGCHAVGLTGSDEKARRCTSRFGYQAAANYKSHSLEDIMADLAPDGVDIYFDNVGGETLDAAIRAMRVGGRIVQCGTASIASWSRPLFGPRNEREVLMRRLIWGGFVIFDHADRYAEALAALQPMVANGSLVFDEDIAKGIECAPDSLRRLYAGENSGKQLIFIG